jgi:protein TonB
MEISPKSTFFMVPVGIFSAIIVTAMLFLALPLLTQIQSKFTKEKSISTVMISSRKPPKPPPPDRDKKIEKREAKKVESQKRKSVTARPRFDLPRVSLSSSLHVGGGIKISSITRKDFNISDSAFARAFKLTEVDQPPRVLRSIPPRYPFVARQKGLEGRVVVRFVVSAEGDVLEPEVAEVEPPDIAGVFDTAALQAVSRYKFKPAVKDGEPVDCIVKLPIAFEIR